MSPPPGRPKEGAGPADCAAGEVEQTSPLGGTARSAQGASTNIAIVNGRVIDPATGFDQVADVYIADGQIAAIGRAPERFKANRTLDARGLIVAPGLVDLCARSVH